MNFELIDLTEGDKKRHPAFNEDDYFLVERVFTIWDWVDDPDDDEEEERQIAVDSGKKGTELHFGQFREVWYGWHFSCGWGASGGFQYDQPGSNSSSWGRCWKLVGYSPLSES